MRPLNYRNVKGMTIDPTRLIIDKTLEYLDIPAVVGHEGYFMNHLVREYESMGLTVTQWPNIMAISGDKGYETIVSAHIDRHGLISIGNGEYAYAGQYVREIKYGQNDRSSQKMLASIHERFVGEKVYAYDSATARTLGSGTIVACDPSLQRGGDALFHVEGMEYLPLNTPVAYARKGRSHGGFLKGQIDNALCVAAIHALFKNGYQGTAILTTEEEIGKSWSHMQDFLTEQKIESDKLVILDTSPYKEHRFVNDGYIVLRNRDKSAIFNMELTENIADYCSINNIPFHFKDQYFLSQGKEIEDLGSTELGRLIMGTARQWTGASIQIPTLEYHTSYETTTHKAIRNFYRVLSDIFIKRAIPELFA